MARRMPGWLRRWKVQATLGIMGGLVLVPVMGVLLQAAEPAWLWPILLAIAEGCLAFLLAFLVLSLFIDREIARARATGGLVTDAAKADASRAVASRGITSYVRRVAAREELAYKQLKADITLLAAEGVVSRSFAEIADDMAAAGHAERQVRRLLARACDEGLLERVEGRPRFRIVATSRYFPAIVDAVRARVPGILEVPEDTAEKPESKPRRDARRSRTGSRAPSPPASRPGPRAVPHWIAPGGDAGAMPGIVAAVLRRVRLAARPVTLHPRLDGRTGVACIVAKRHVNKADGTEQVTAVMVPMDAKVDEVKLRQVAASRHRLFGTARAITVPGGDVVPSTGGSPSIADGTRVLVDRALLENEQFYLCAENRQAWIFVRRAEVRRARVPEVSVVKDAAPPSEDASN